MGSYLWELFLHAPLSLARQLSLENHFEQAQRWYHYLYDPRKEKPWTFSPFTDDIPSLHRILTDAQALEAWRNDPFDPHAIAVTRPSAYQQAIVLGYVANLVDWGDELFGRYTPESLSRAALLYEMAAELLGPRPVTLTAPGSRNAPDTYAGIKACIREDSWLIEYQAAIETRHLGLRLSPTHNPDRDQGERRLAPAPVFGDGLGISADDVAGVGDGWALGRLASRELGQSGQSPSSAAGGSARAPVTDDAARPTGGGEGALGTLRRVDRGGVVQFGADLWRQLTARTSPAAATADSGGESQPRPLLRRRAPRQPVFLVPRDEQLTRLWDRVDNRLANLRAGSDINGVRRALEAYEPPIDPGLLIAQRAAGVSLTQALEAVAGGAVPPYRFGHLLAKAQAAASAAAALGSSLQRALESRDAEQLAVLRVTHETNLITLNAAIRKEEIAAAKVAHEAAQKELETAGLRKQQYDNLINAGNNAAENVETTAQQVSMLIEQGVPVISGMRGVAGLIPNLGAPTAITFGGVQLEKAVSAAGEALKAVSLISSMVATGAGMQARYSRREQEWTNQRDLANSQMQQLKKNVAAAQSRLTLAEKAEEVHTETLAQSQAMLEFYGAKFSNLALHNWLAQRLHQLYQETYTNALSLARLAATAYAFERAAAPPTVAGGWNAARGGLLAAESLQADLARMERQHLETDVRLLEVEQHFSLAQIDPMALVDLRRTGGCSFTIPEVYFDVAYPGQYQRRLKAVRLSVPCVTGPFTNVSATLTLNNGQIRATSDGLLVAGRKPVTSTIAASSAQRDAGLFELHFRDERYLPFEGAGAVDSNWGLQLPGEFRSFDYDTISDVVLHLAYTARYDPDLRAKKETDVRAGLDVLRAWLLPDQPDAYPLVRVLSVRRDFPAQWAAVSAQQQETEPEPVTLQLTVTAEHYPYLIQPLLQPKDNRVLRAKAAVHHDRGTASTELAVPEHVPDGDAATGTFNVRLNPQDLNGLRDVHLQLQLRLGQVSAP
jgi:hypothetical protein